MPICGFCKKEITFEENEPNSVQKEKFKAKYLRFYAFSCPHCNAVLSTWGSF